MNQALLQIIVIIACGGVVYTYVLPAFGQVAVIQEQITEYESAIKLAESANQKARDLRQVKESISEAKIARLEEALPEQLDPLQYAYELETLALEENLFVTSISVEEPTETITNEQENDDGTIDGIAIMKQGVTLTVQGTYPEIKSFIKRIEYDAQLTEILDLSITPDDDEFLTADFTLELSAKNI